MVDKLSHLLLQPVLHNWCNDDMYYPVCGMVHIKDHLLLIRIKDDIFLINSYGSPMIMNETVFIKESVALLDKGSPV